MNRLDLQRISGNDQDNSGQQATKGPVQYVLVMAAPLNHLGSLQPLVAKGSLNKPQIVSRTMDSAPSYPQIIGITGAEWSLLILVSVVGRARRRM